MRPCAGATLLAAIAVGGCGGGGGAPAAPTAGASPPAATSSGTSTPTTPAAGAARYAASLDVYCATTVRAVRRLGRTAEDREDPVRPVAVFARRYRAGLERFGRLTPPPALRAFHLLTLAAGRESADRLEDGVRLGRQGDTDAATSALETIDSLLPAGLPTSLRRAAPTCARGLG